MKHNNIIYKYYYQTYMKKNLWLIWIIMLVPFILFPQKQTFIQPLPAQKSISSLNNDNPEVNAEYVKALQKYEALIKEYPGEKKLYYNIGNLNYLNGDTESALKNYQNSLIDSDPNLKAHTLYNMGNTLYQMGDLQKSVELFKEALILAPDDEDIRHNYELSKRILEQQPPQEHKDQNQDKKERDKEQNQNKENQQSQEGEKQEQESESVEKKNNEEGDEKPEQSENGEEQDEKEQENSQNQDGDENNKEEQNQQQSESTIQEQKEKQLGREEAEAILNALKADESNLKPRKYKSMRRIKLEKDW